MPSISLERAQMREQASFQYTAFEMSLELFHLDLLREAGKDKVFLLYLSISYLPNLM